jgi:hypothetical protein
MAIRNFKEIIDNKGYRVDSKDRKIFEEGNLQSFFGFGENDVIEFIVYDSSDNQLPQKDGNLVRYIPLSTDNISDYFMVPEGILFEKNQLPKEYFIDVERLLREAGYNNGVFKTQITLLNFRLGNNLEKNKVWISEISPSRLEVRLLPIRNSNNLNNKLEEQFSIFVNGGNFRDDTSQLTSVFAESITPQLISSVLISKFGEKYFYTFLAEYKIQDFESFVTKIYEKFLEAFNYEFSNKISHINDINYGKPKPTQLDLKLSVSDIKREAIRILAEIVDYYLYTPLQTNTNSMNDESGVSVDINNIIKDVETNPTKVGTDKPQYEEEVVTMEIKSKPENEKVFDILVEKELGFVASEKINSTDYPIGSTVESVDELPTYRNTTSPIQLPNSQNVTVVTATSVGELVNKSNISNFSKSEINTTPIKSITSKMVMITESGEIDTEYGE